MILGTPLNTDLFFNFGSILRMRLIDWPAVSKHLKVVDVVADIQFIQLVQPEPNMDRRIQIWYDLSGSVLVA